MKKIIYIFLFIILGIILSFFIHAAVEIPILWLFTKDFNQYGLGLSWQSWYLIHYVGSIVLLALGIIFGYFQGKHWWKVIYIEKKRKK